jgi:predicted metal-binding membrane protein
MRGVRGYLGRASAALRWRPEWPAAVVAVFAWAALLTAPGGHAQGNRGHAEAAGAELKTGLVCYPRERPEQATWARSSTQASSGVLAGMPHVTLMAMAMMAPVALPAVRHVGLNSLRRRRQRAMGLYLGVYVIVLGGFGAVALAAVHVVRESLVTDERVLLALALALAAAWQLTREKRRAVLACTRTVPLPPSGLRADVACARFALKGAYRCMRSCWALMVVMAVVGPFGLAWMAALTGLILIEERTLMGRRLLRPSGGVLALGAALVALG